MEGALGGYEASLQNGENYWWGGKPKENRSQWSLINTDKPNSVIHFGIPNVGSLRDNDCVPTTLYEIEKVKGGNRTYDDFLKKITLTNEGVYISPKEYMEKMRELFGPSIEKITPNILFDPDFMRSVAEKKGVISIQFKNPGHADNVRTLRVFNNNPPKNTITFRQKLFNTNKLKFNTQNTPTIILWIK